MASKFCDKTPCPEMKKAFDVLVPKNLSDGPIRFIVHPNNPALPPQLVYIGYCPFCGTRIDPEWLEEMMSRG